MQKQKNQGVEIDNKSKRSRNRSKEKKLFNLFFLIIKNSSRKMYLYLLFEKIA